MNTPSTTISAPISGGIGRAVLVLVPALVLAWPGPGSFLRGDFTPQATGIGVAALLLLPAALVLLIRRVRTTPRGFAFLLAPVGVAVAWTIQILGPGERALQRELIPADRVTDTFEASRVLIGWFVAIAALFVGSSLGASGRATLVRGAALISIGLTGFALYDGGSFGGALDNTGSVSEAAIIGAVCGAVLVFEAILEWRIVGAIAFALFIVYATRVPVLAGAASAAIALGAWALASRGSARARSVALVAVAIALVAFILPIAAPRSAAASSGTTTASTSSAPAPSSATGGFAVRRLIWQSSLPMFAAHPFAGVGPGQFAVFFPRFRDPREIELTTHQRRNTDESEVEHPHNDWLLPWLEGGIVAGLGWSAFLLTVAFAAWRKLRSREAAEIALGVAALALLANALVRAPLTSNPASSVMAFAVFGALLARAEHETKQRSARVIGLAAVVLLAVVSPRAWAFVRHGNALHDLATPDQDGKVVQRAVADALAACPDSAQAHSISARIAEQRGDGAPIVISEWARVLELRPLRVEALMQIGTVAARAGDVALARSSLVRALAVDRDHPGLLRNLAMLELSSGRLDAGLAVLDRLQAAHPPDDQWSTSLALHLALKGVDDACEKVLARIDSDLAGRTAEECYALSKEAREAGKNQSGDAWEARAQRMWARDHARNGRFKNAVANYRQDVRLCTTHVPSGPTRSKLELAAALFLTDRPDDARQQLATVTPTQEDWAAIEDWAAKRLRAELGEAKK